ncbi:putative DNA-binding transcriptional regulator YafY [Enterococcus sp. PF1-24]|uniref:helix-turn-helix transcriptional regulator n=1 Tax=unclassified Enterococcus TaxID=2608891 RepID=UPI00247518B0|nr:MULTISPECIES: YafY family protein [unclassified Enterococcus]MDH6364385.1 putative DNA-binding transcriptional regulator YafY [Enterococcus sp. PFB1-1]MDH6401426.1 putative DNA-binding transcriptional regulator YafY [Enterococcus sp. PF1-24]
MTESRLLQMLLLLLEKGNTTAPALAEKFEVSVRTIYRDIDALSAAGVPVYTIQGQGGGIFIQEEYVLNKLLISEAEQNQILLALQNLNFVEQENTLALLGKLKGIFQKSAANWLEVDFSDWGINRELLYSTLQQAIVEKQQVKFTYLSYKGQFFQREVEPLKLVFKGKSWYLYAFCHLRADYRLFKLARMKELQVTSEYFQRTAPEKVLPQVTSAPMAMVDLTLAFPAELAYRVYENFEKITEKADGSFEVQVTLPDNESSYQFLLSFGARVEVLAPAEFRKQMQMEIEKLYHLYQT